MSFYFYVEQPSDPEERKKNQDSKVQKLLKEINAKFQELEDAADEAYVVVHAELPADLGTATREPWQASGGCEWEESRQDEAWSASSC
jgi:hypothetical protein